jgi:hypothetical protein
MAIAIAVAIVGAEVKRSRAGTCGTARWELGDGRWEMGDEMSNGDETR